jgi:hypothetical protein
MIFIGCAVMVAQKTTLTYNISQTKVDRRSVVRQGIIVYAFECSRILVKFIVIMAHVL